VHHAIPRRLAWANSSFCFRWVTIDHLTLNSWRPTMAPCAPRRPASPVAYRTWLRPEEMRHNVRRTSWFVTSGLCGCLNRLVLQKCRSVLQKLLQHRCSIGIADGEWRLTQCCFNYPQRFDLTLATSSGLSRRSRRSQCRGVNASRLPGAAVCIASSRTNRSSPARPALLLRNSTGPAS